MKSVCDVLADWLRHPHRMAGLVQWKTRCWATRRNEYHFLGWLLVDSQLLEAIFWETFLYKFQI